MDPDARDWKRYLEHADEDHRYVMQRFFDDTPIFARDARVIERRPRRRPNVIRIVVAELGKLLLRAARGR